MNEDIHGASVPKARRMAPAGQPDMIRLRDCTLPQYLNTSRSTVYYLVNNDSDFRKLVPVVHLRSVPYVHVADLVAFKALKRQQALIGRNTGGRPRKNRQIPAEQTAGK